MFHSSRTRCSLKRVATHTSHPGKISHLKWCGTQTVSEPPDSDRSLSAYRRENRILASLLLVLFAWAVVQSYGYELWRGSQPGAGLVPFIVSVGVVVLCVVWLFVPGSPEDDLVPLEQGDDDGVPSAEAPPID